MAKRRKKKPKQFPIGKSMVAVVLLGAFLGVLLAWLKQRSEEQALEALWQSPNKLSPVLFPEAAAEPLAEALPSPEDAEPALAALEGLPHYPGSLPQGFHSAVVADGKPIDMARFFTDDSVEVLRAFYERAFEERGLHFVSHAFSPQAGYIGYMDWENEALHLVSYIRQGSQTLVFPSKSRPTQQLEASELPPEVPEHPHATLVKTVRFMEPEGATRLSYSATVANEHLGAVKAFYLEALAGGGWSGMQEKEEGGRVQVEATNGQMAANFIFEQQQSDVGIYVLLMGKSPGREP